MGQRTVLSDVGIPGNSMRWAAIPFIHLLIHLSIQKPTHPSIYLPMPLPCTPIHPSIHPSLHPSSYLLIHPFFALSIQTFIHPFTYLSSIHLSIHPNIHPSIYPLNDHPSIEFTAANQALYTGKTAYACPSVASSPAGRQRHPLSEVG